MTDTTQEYREIHLMLPSTLRQMMVMPSALLLPLIPLVLICTWSFIYLVPGYRTPEDIPYWALLFGLPHIVASFQTMCDAEYVASYKKQIAIILILFFTPFVLHKMGLSTEIILTFFTAITVHHVVSQQLGIALSVAHLRPSLISMLCKWTTISLGVAAFYYPYLLSQKESLSSVITVINNISLPALLIIFLTGAFLVWRVRFNKLGATILAINLFLFISALALIFKTPYLLIGLMLVRILHDVTSFIIYIAHDSNRNRNGRKNILYRAFPFFPIWLLNPILAIIIASVLSYLATGLGFFWWLIIGITTAHYFIEGIIWRGKTPHRQHFSLTNGFKNL